SLSPKMFYDYRILRMAIKAELFNFADLKVYSHNPMTYAGLLDVNSISNATMLPWNSDWSRSSALKRKHHRSLRQQQQIWKILCPSLISKQPLPLPGERWIF